MNISYNCCKVCAVQTSTFYNRIYWWSHTTILYLLKKEKKLFLSFIFKEINGNSNFNMNVIQIIDDNPRKQIALFLHTTLHSINLSIYSVFRGGKTWDIILWNDLWQDLDLSRVAFHKSLVPLLLSDVLSPLPPLTKSVEKRVEGRVERQNEDCCPHVDTTWNWHSGTGHKTHDAYREPAAKVSKHHHK